MKILKYGNKERALRGICPDCGCEFECEKDETMVVTTFWGDSSYPTKARVVKCPYCEKDCYVK